MMLVNKFNEKTHQQTHLQTHQHKTHWNTKKLVSSLGGIPDDLSGDILIDFGNDVLGADIIDDLGDDILRDTV